MFRINNVFRNKYVALYLQTELSNPSSSIDNSRSFRLVDITTDSNRLDIYKRPWTRNISNNTVSYYGAYKLDYDNQYGQIENII